MLFVVRLVTVRNEADDSGVFKKFRVRFLRVAAVGIKTKAKGRGSTFG